METEQAIQPQILPGKRAWLSRWSGALFVSVALVSLTLAFWALGGFGAMGLAFALARGEPLFVDSSAKSFGVASPGELIALSFKITNKGSKSIRILGCEASCSCILPPDLPFTLSPNQSRDLSFSIQNPKPEKAGPAKKIDLGIALFTSNPTQPRIPLTIKGEIR